MSVVMQQSLTGEPIFTYDTSSNGSVDYKEVTKELFQHVETL